MLCFRKDTQWPKDFNPALLVCGLDNAGKSTIICRICNDTSDPTPTVGFVPHNVKLHGKSIRLYDVGGGERIRAIWESYYEEVYGVIYVIDATDVTRLSETGELIKSLLSNALLLRKPFLILANKQDTNGALNQAQLAEKLSLSGENVHIGECSAIKSTVDKSIKDGLMWVLNYIYDNYDELLVKVSGDCAVKEEKKKIEREQRQARIRKAREEREKEEAEKMEAEVPKKEDDSGEDDLVCSPFKPVKQAFVEEVNTSKEHLLSSPEPPSDSQKTPKKKKKKKRKGNKVTPLHSNEGSLMSLASNNSAEVPKLAPLSPKSKLPEITPGLANLERSSLPPIKNAPIQNVVKDDSDVQKVQLSDLVDNKEEEKREVTVPGIFGNCYVEVERLENKPSLPMENLHTIKLDRGKFLDSINING